MAVKKIHRVNTTLNESRDTNRDNKVYAYEVILFEESEEVFLRCLKDFPSLR